VEVKETVDASVRLGRDEALRRVRQGGVLIVSKGKNVARFEIKKDSPDDGTLLSHILGPTGNLRAPTVRVGKTLLVGFNEDAYREVFEM